MDCFFGSAGVFQRLGSTPALVAPIRRFFVKKLAFQKNEKRGSKIFASSMKCDTIA
jgi:hypothetical protein